MFDCYAISGGKAAYCEFEKASPGKTYLALCTNPTDADISRISKKIGIAPGEIKDAIHKDTGPRIDLKEECAVISYRSPHAGNSKTITMPSVIFVRGALVAAVFKSPMKNIDALHTELSQGIIPPVFRYGIPGIVACIFDKINDEFCDNIDNISAHAEAFEKKLHGLSKEDTKTIYSLNMTLAYFQRALIGNREVLKELSSGEVPGFSGTKVRELFSDIQKDVIEIIDAEEIQKSTINNIFVFHSSILSNELNMVMKKLTAIGAIILFPTFIAAIYGMNIDGLPFAKSEYSFHIISLVLAVGAGAIAIYFKKKRWI